MSKVCLKHCNNFLSKCRKSSTFDKGENNFRKNNDCHCLQDDQRYFVDEIQKHLNFRPLVGGQLDKRDKRTRKGEI